MRVDPRVLDEIPGPSPSYEAYSEMKLDELENLRYELVDMKALIQTHISHSWLQDEAGNRLEPGPYHELKDKLRDQVSKLDRMLRLTKEVLKDKHRRFKKTQQDYVRSSLDSIAQILSAGHRKGIAMGLTVAAVLLEDWAFGMENDEGDFDSGLDPISSINLAAQVMRERSNSLIDHRQANGVCRIFPEIRRKQDMDRKPTKEEERLIQAFEGIEMSWLEG